MAGFVTKRDSERDTRDDRPKTRDTEETLTMSDIQTQTEIKDEPILSTPETTAPKDDRGNDTDPDPYCCAPGGGTTGPDGTP